MTMEYVTILSKAVYQKKKKKNHAMFSTQVKNLYEVVTTLLPKLLH